MPYRFKCFIKLKTSRYSDAVTWVSDAGPRMDITINLNKSFCFRQYDAHKNVIYTAEALLFK